MLTIEIHNAKGGVGCTTIAYHLLHGAQEIGLRVAAMSIDPTGSLGRELEGTGTPVLEPGAPLEAEYDLLIVDRNAQCPKPIDADVRLIPIANRRSWECACDLSDRYTGSIFWVPNMSEERPEVPAYLEGAVQVIRGIPRSRGIAEAEWRRTVVWTDPDLAESPGAHDMRVAVFDILRWVMGPDIVLDHVSGDLPIEPGASAILRHGPRAGYRVAKVSPELHFGGEEEEDARAELELVHLSGGREEPLGAWTFGDAPPELRDFLQRPPTVGVGDGLLFKITNTGRRPITAARLVVDDDTERPVTLARERPTAAPTL
ncbi:MAG: hypothetical protein R3B09_15975 [Nannocystaceae bacterium]